MSRVLCPWRRSSAIAWWRMVQYGWSRCQVSLVQNSGQGSDLGRFYQLNRVIPGDKFKVQV